MHLLLLPALSAFSLSHCWQQSPSTHRFSFNINWVYQAIYLYIWTEREMYSPSLSNVWGQRWRSAVTAHQPSPPALPWPVACPITKLLAQHLSPGAHIYFQEGGFFVTFGKSARPWIGSEVKTDLSTLFGRNTFGIVAEIHLTTLKEIHLTSSAAHLSRLWPYWAGRPAGRAALDLSQIVNLLSLQSVLEVSQSISKNL